MRAGGFASDRGGPASRYLCYGVAPAIVQIMKDLAGDAPAGLLAGAHLAGVIMCLKGVV